MPEGQMTFSVCLDQDGDSCLVLSTLLLDDGAVERVVGLMQDAGQFVQGPPLCHRRDESSSKPTFLSSLAILLPDASSPAQTAQTRKLTVVKYQEGLLWKMNEANTHTRVHSCTCTHILHPTHTAKATRLDSNLLNGMWGAGGRGQNQISTLSTMRSSNSVCRLKVPG